MIADVLILGSGPAGLSIAAAVAKLGASVVHLSPNHLDQWDNNYGVWVDDLVADIPFAHVFNSAAVKLSRETVNIDRQYAIVSNGKLRRKFERDCSEHSVARLHGRAEQIIEFDHQLRVVTDEGEEIYAKTVIDATGAKSAFTKRNLDGQAFQTAYGLVIKAKSAPIDSDCVFMDWSNATHASGPPSFLYGFKKSDDTYFVEETVLAAAPAFSIKKLEDRLVERLGEIVILETLETERCFIPMGGALPGRDNVVIAFGAAAGMVHPASGYMLAHTLNTAPRLARVIVDNLDESVKNRSHAAYDAIWSESTIRRYALFQYGLSILCEMNDAEIGNFFQAFFSLPTEKWSRYLRLEGSLEEATDVMRSVFAAADWKTRKALAGGVFKGQFPLLRRGIFGR